ncbi:MAG: hypothetical protein ACK56I_06405, partial [bacterium]
LLSLQKSFGVDWACSEPESTPGGQFTSDQRFTLKIGRRQSAAAVDVRNQNRTQESFPVTQESDEGY